MVVTQGFSADHPAIDFVPPLFIKPIGCAIGALGPATVAYVGWDDRPELQHNPQWDRGYYVQLNHGEGIMSAWCHLLPEPQVEVGQRVRTGQIVGLMGATGYVRPAGDAGAHCHGWVRVNGVAVDWREWI